MSRLIYESELDTESGEEPAPLLLDNIGVHTTTMITGAQKIVDVQPEGNGAKRIFASDVQDATGRHLLAHDGRCVVVVIDVIRTVGVQFLVQGKVNEV